MAVSVSAQSTNLNDAIEKTVRKFAFKGNNFHATNPTQGYQSEFSPEARLSLKIDNKLISTRTTAYGQGAVRGSLPAPTRELKKDVEGWPTLAFRRPNFTEWYVNGQNGLRQWFRIGQKLGQSGPLYVRIGLTGATKVKQTSDTSTEIHTGNQVLTYGGLKAWDSRGKRLPARLETKLDQITINVDDREAVYPVTIDPVWTQEQQIITPTGVNISDIDLDGDDAIVGIEGTAFDDRKGVAYVFHRTNGVWVEQQALTLTDALKNDALGQKVGIAGDTAIAVRRGYGQTEKRAICVFTRTDGVWTHTQTLEDFNYLNKFFAYTDVGINHDTIAVIAQEEDYSVAAYTYTKSEGIWSPTQNIRLAMPFKGIGYLSLNDNRLVIGMPSLNSGKGGLFVYSKSGGAWSLMQKIDNDGDNYGSTFGRHSAIKGNDLVVSAPYQNDTIGGVYVYHYNGTEWGLTQKILPNFPKSGDYFGSAVDIDGDNLIVGRYQLNEAWAYRRVDGVWYLAQILAPFERSTGPWFGYHVKLSGEDALVSGSTSDGSQAALYAFKRSGADFVSLEPEVPSICGSLGTRLRVTLSSPAPVGGTVVSLKSDDADYLVPATVTVPEGGLALNIPITTGYVTTDRTAHVKADAGDMGTASAEVLIRFPRVIGVSFDKSVIGTYETAIGTVSFEVPAPAGGLVATLDVINSPVVDCPRSVAVAAGSATGTFEMTARKNLDNQDAYVRPHPSYDDNLIATIAVNGFNNFGPMVFADNPLLYHGQTTATVQLVEPAPKWGFTVYLDCDTKLIGLPIDRVSVPEGATSFSFVVNNRAWRKVEGTITARSHASIATGTLHIVRPVVASVSVSPGTVRGGESATLLVTLDQPAPNGGLVAYLASSKQDLAPVPASVTIPSGATSGSAQIKTSIWDLKGYTVELLAHLQGDANKVTKLTVLATPLLDTFRLQPDHIPIGGKSKGVIRLAAPAGPGGVVIGLSNNSGAVGLPALVTVPAGSKYGYFTITSTGIAATVHITATGTGRVGTATLIIGP